MPRQWHKWLAQRLFRWPDVISTTKLSDIWEFSGIFSRSTSRVVLKFHESADSGCAWLETTVAGSYTSAIPEPPAPASRQDRSTSPGLPFDDSRLLRISTRMPDHVTEPLSA